MAGREAFHRGKPEAGPRGPQRSVAKARPGTALAVAPNNDDAGSYRRRACEIRHPRPCIAWVVLGRGGQFTGGHGMSQDNRLKTAASLSALWDGGPIRRVRAGDGVIILRGRRFAFHIMIQPGAAI